jgi:glycosyltransferase involved in cell wall biosynthesis
LSELKKVVLFANQLVSPGGGERLMLEEAKYFEKKGVKVKVWAFDAKKAGLYDYQVNVDLIGGKGLISRIVSLRKKLKEIRPDLLIMHSSGDCIYAYFATKFTGIPYVTFIHGTLFWFHDDLMKYAFIHKKVFDEIRESVIGHKEFVPSKLPKVSPLKRVKLEVGAILEYLAVRGAKRIFVLSNHNKWEVGKIYNKNAIVAKGALDPKIFSYKAKKNIKKELRLENKRIVLNVNRLDPRKRVDLLIKAFKFLSEKREDIVLVIGGIGPEEKNLKNLVEKLNLQDKVLFVGFIKEEDLLDYYSACDVFVHPNWAEFAIAPYEALALQKKVVWSSEMETDESILKSGLVFVANPTVKDFAREIENALTAKVKGRVDLSDYTWDKYFDKINHACEEAIVN